MPTFRLKPPGRVHPLVRKLYDRMKYEDCPAVLLAERSGVDRVTILNWIRGRSNPRLTDLDACFGVLGYKLVAKEEE